MSTAYEAYTHYPECMQLENDKNWDWVVKFYPLPKHGGEVVEYTGQANTKQEAKAECQTCLNANYEQFKIGE